MFFPIKWCNGCWRLLSGYSMIDIIFKSVNSVCRSKPAGQDKLVGWRASLTPNRNSGTFYWGNRASGQPHFYFPNIRGSDRFFQNVSFHIHVSRLKL
jgi:hypothetical protein